MTQANMAQSGQFLMLGLVGEVFAVDATMIREILDPVPVAEVPGAKPFLQGVINVRGKIVPMADLRIRFGMETTAVTPDTRFVVMEIELHGEPTTVAIVVEKVHEVTELSFDSMSKAPPVGMRLQPEFITGIALWKDDFVVLPSMERIFH
ncbi:MAG: chemotaxis protein CheW [Methylovirgula sp.]